MAAMRDYHVFKKDDGETFRVPKNRSVDLSLFKNVSQVSVSLTYSIANKKRQAKFKGGRYGSSNMYLPRLYELLSKVFNGGMPLIDKYLKNIGKRPIGKEIRDLTQSLAEQLFEEKERILARQRLTKKGLFDKRIKAFAELKKFETLKDKALLAHAGRIEKAVQSDIVRLLYIGKLPIDKKHVSDVTVAARERIGVSLPSSVVFYSTGQLASSIKLHFDIQLNEEGALNAV